MELKKVNIIGAGNVATHLSKALFANGIEIMAVYSRDFVNARELSVLFGAKAIDNIEDIDRGADLNIVTIKDDAIAEVVKKLRKHVPAVHTSGAAPMDIFEGFDHYGVLYPLQTFSKQRALDIAAIPFLIEANSPEFEEELSGFCQTYLSDNVVQSDSEKRGRVHLAAVFACNFTTQLLRESDLLLQESDMDWSVLHPLIRETLEKSVELGPLEAMTGPAKRKDLATIEKHLNQLTDESQKTIYRLLSERIMANT